ncbi:OX-2 membrane glycoprotein-like [Brienomyrus brachyistius]|uniref:OX-2 membrane glycoprotein-like n=1 Tax=Brienomyrus brachyistius TaxID=42636 RepID=UPI0020B1CB54|nr:OX-2 membrane glycoprotein-like [Brienomyrus brachyistius]
MDNQSVTLESPTFHTTGVTVKKVSLEDKGCYMCVFHVYPSGSQERSICLEIMANLSTEGNKTAVSGKPAKLSCQFSPSEGVKQVHWKKTEEQGDTRDVAFNSKDGKPVIEEPFKDHVTLSNGISETNLYIKPVKVEDEGCYTCEFTYYGDMESGTACLAVYVLPKTELNYRTVSPEIIEANCTALARPAVQIRWAVEKDNRTLSPSVSSVFEQGDGTSVVHSTLLVKADLLKELHVKCLVYHPGLESPIYVSLNTKIGKPFTVLICVTTVATLLILCLCIYLWKCVLRSDCCGEKPENWKETPQRHLDAPEPQSIHLKHTWMAGPHPTVTPSSRPAMQTALQTLSILPQM